MSSARIHSLYHYPVKSCAALPISKGAVTQSGFEHDRRWMIVDAESGKFITQRKYGFLSRIYAAFDSSVLSFHHADKPSLGKLNVPILKDQRLTTEVWGDKPEAWDQGDEIAHWLSSIIGKQVRLAYIDDNQLRQVDMDYANQGDRVGFADGFPFLITTTASIDQFNNDLGYDVSVTRFRPNIVIEGDELAPYAEDTWRKVIINGIEFELVKPCSRCVMPSVNPQTGERERKVIETLVATRKEGNATFFGQNAVHSEVSGVLNVGDSVEIIGK